MENSPYRYQLLGSPFAAEFEQRIGRKLEATDKFYKITSASLLPDTQYDYLYHKESKTTFQVDPKNLKARKGIWFWNPDGTSKKNSYLSNTARRKELFNVLEKEKITEMYTCLGVSDFEREEVKSFIREAYEKGINVEFLLGRPEFIAPYSIEDGSAIQKKVDAITKYNSAARYDEKISGIHYDVEVYYSTIYLDKAQKKKMSDFVKSNAPEHLNSDRKQYFVSFVNQASQYVREHAPELTITFDMVPWMQAYDCNYNGTTVNIMEEIYKNSDYVSLMNYKDSGVEMYIDLQFPIGTGYSSENGRLTYTATCSDGSQRNKATQVDLAQKYQKRFLSGIEFGNAGNEVSFYEEDLSYAHEQLTLIGRLLEEPDFDLTAKRLSMKQQGKDLFGYELNAFDQYGFSYHNVEYLMAKYKA